MGRLFLLDLKGRFYSCKYCRTPLALARDILNRAFFSTNGRAYLCYNVVNVTGGEKEHRLMITGWHTVIDIYCVGCGSILGWEYVTADSNRDKYKEGRFLLERCKVLNPDGIPYVANQEAQVGQPAQDDQEPEIGQEAQVGQQAQDDQEPEIGHEAQAGGGDGADNA